MNFSRQLQLLCLFAAAPALSACAQNAPLQIETRALAQEQPRPATAPLAVQPSPAFAAEEFIDSIGINGSPIHNKEYKKGAPRPNTDTYDSQIFTDLGIRYYRQALKYDLTRDDQPQQVAQAYRASGARDDVARSQQSQARRGRRFAEAIRPARARVG